MKIGLQFIKVKKYVIGILSHPMSHTVGPATFSVVLHSGRNLIPQDITGTSDVYCKFILHNPVKPPAVTGETTTSVINKTLNPKWGNHKVSWNNLVFQNNTWLEILVYDKDKIGFDDSMGRVIIPLNWVGSRASVSELTSFKMKRSFDVLRTKGVSNKKIQNNQNSLGTLLLSISLGPILRLPTPKQLYYNIEHFFYKKVHPDFIPGLYTTYEKLFSRSDHSDCQIPLCLTQCWHFVESELEFFAGEEKFVKTQQGTGGLYHHFLFLDDYTKTDFPSKNPFHSLVMIEFFLELMLEPVLPRSITDLMITVHRLDSSSMDSEIVLAKLFANTPSYIQMTFYFCCHIFNQIHAVFPDFIERNLFSLMRQLKPDFDMKILYQRLNSIFISKLAKITSYNDTFLDQLENKNIVKQLRSLCKIKQAVPNPFQSNSASSPIQSTESTSTTSNSTTFSTPEL